MRSSELIEDLIERTKEVLNQAEDLKQKTPKVLKARPKTGGWNALECIEHLNRYGDFYLPEISKRLENSSSKSDTFKSGWLGNYFAKSMLPKEKLNKMNTFKSMNPIETQLEVPTLDRFINQQHKMLKLLDQCRSADLTKIKTSISISKWIKLRLGDTLRVVIYHNQRHLVQARKAVEG